MIRAGLPPRIASGFDSDSVCATRVIHANDSLRLTAAERRLFAAEARRRGISLSEYLREAGRREATRTDWKTFFRQFPAVTLPPDAPTDLSTREGFGD